MKNKLKYIMVASLWFGASGFNSVMAEVLNLTANMDCDQTGAGVGTCGAGGNGIGVGTMTFDTVTNLLSWNVSHSGLSSAASDAHFHGPALPNQNAGIQVGIGITNPAVDSVVLTSTQAAELLTGQWYIDIHSAAFPSGEIRGQVNIVPDLPCNLQLNQSSFIDGDIVTADTFRFANLTGNPVTVEMKVWLSVPGESPVSVINLGSDGSFVLPAGSDITLGPLSLLPVTADLPRGNYEFSCRLLDPVTGELLTEDRNLFTIQDERTYSIGSAGPAGGIVFHVTDGGLHGLEAAPVDLSSAQWGCSGSEVPGADGTAIGTGAQNTADILSACATPDIAARRADAYTLNSFEDWFLPSQDELNELYLNRFVVGGFVSRYYWSSSEFTGAVNNNIALLRDFANGGPLAGLKSNPHAVRAVRVF